MWLLCTIIDGSDEYINLGLFKPLHVFATIMSSFRAYTLRNRRGLFRRPESVHVEPFLDPTRRARLPELDQAALLAQLMRNQARHAVREMYPDLSDDDIDATSMGYLQGINVNNAGATISTKPLRVGHLTTEFFMDLMERIHKSNDDLTFDAIEWSFHFVTLSTLRGSGGNTLRMPPWATKSLHTTWVEHAAADGTPIGCAVFAINWMMNKSRFRYNKTIERLRTARKHAYALQRELGWGQNVSTTQLPEFIVKYPEYRLTVMTANCTDFSYMTWAGLLWKYNPDTPDDKCIYIIYDFEQKHFAGGLPSNLTSGGTGKCRFCHYCCLAYSHNSVHKCPLDADYTPSDPPAKKARKDYFQPFPVQPKKTDFCDVCGLYGKHPGCPMRTCGVCKVRSPLGDYHRHIVQMPPRSDVKNTFVTGGSHRDQDDKKLYKLWAYDIESMMEAQDGVLTMQFDTDPNSGTFKYTPDGELAFRLVKPLQHVPIMIAFKDVFSNEPVQVYKGPTCLSEFIGFMCQHNGGRNICVAHNASGYDSRLLFDEAVTKSGDGNYSIVPLSRGHKFMQLTLNKNTMFRDSMLHLKGSLKNLAKDFLSKNMRKGYFPHLFNTPEHQTYIGPVPEKHYFDLTFSAGSEEDIEDFNRWHMRERRKNTLWNFAHELEAYCINDVELLAEVMLTYHNILLEKFGLSPWFNATSPSYVHEVFLTKLSSQLELGDPTQSTEYLNNMTHIAKNEFWAVLEGPEYWFARAALRGGRTDIRKVYHSVSDEDWARGVRIRYQDIVSMYPYVQAVEDYPVGHPTIHVYDLNFYPCTMHKDSLRGECCPPDWKKNLRPERFMDIVDLSNEAPPTKEEILNDPDFFGIVCATVICPKNMYHPILLKYDEKAEKCVAPVGEIYQGFFTSAEFVLALQNGYELDILHRYDKYAKRPSLWADILKDMYIEKMANSKPAPSFEKQTQLVTAYEQKFGMGDMVRKSFSRWNSNPARKQTAKIQLNSGWGKHAQRPIMPETTIIDHTDSEAYLTLLNNCSENRLTLHSIRSFENKTVFSTSQHIENTNPNFHRTYLPAAVFVPAYGRIMLWKQMHKLGKRVLMHDTDSIVYIYDPEQYNIPEGNVWGDWEVEDIDSKNDGIREFVGLGPKSYALKMGNGTTSCKCKGVSIKQAQKSILNFDVMKTLVLDSIHTPLETRRQTGQTVDIPQMTFGYKPGQGIQTRYFLKTVGFDYTKTKGFMQQGDYHIYPPGGYEDDV